MLNPVNAEILGKTGHVFCLIATPEEIRKRVSVDFAIERPLLQVSNPKERIVKLLRERRERYGKFLQIVQDIIDLL